MQALQKGNCKKTKPTPLLGFAVSDWNKSNQKAKGKQHFTVNPIGFISLVVFVFVWFVVIPTSQQLWSCRKGQLT